MVRFALSFVPLDGGKRQTIIVDTKSDIPRSGDKVFVHDELISTVSDVIFVPNSPERYVLVRCESVSPKTSVQADQLILKALEAGWRVFDPRRKV